MLLNVVNQHHFNRKTHKENKLVVTKGERLLLELLELLFDKFNAVAAAHSVVLGYLQDTVVTPLTQQEDVKLYDMADVWVKIQDVLQSTGSRHVGFSSCGTRAQSLWLTGSRVQAQ
ncbi:hypothetical protein J1605_009577 [Eschrichtius robustus]|uniref:Exocyst complex component Sec8 n=1 Tax=Eschrichtius robustus TaxID=9764 RepID=A0AB34GTZ9_ESCRO|nr:hypothetical protein J1605_009577 [Eschrichtius robustus]